MPVPKFETATNGFETRGRCGPKDRIRERRMESVVNTQAVSRRINLHALFLSRSPFLREHRSGAGFQPAMFRRKSGVPFSDYGRQDACPTFSTHHAGDPPPFVAWKCLIRFTEHRKCAKQGRNPHVKKTIDRNQHGISSRSQRSDLFKLV